MTELKAFLNLRKSNKTGKEYFALEIPITDNYKKIVFLDQAEIELVKLIYNNK